MMSSKKILKCEADRFFLDKRMSISFFVIILSLLILFALYSIYTIKPYIHNDETVEYSLSDASREYLENRLNEYKSMLDGTYEGMRLPNETPSVIKSKINYYSFLLENNVNPDWFYTYSDNLISNSNNYGTNEMFLWFNISMYLMFVVAILLPIYSIGIEKEKDRIKNFMVNNTSIKNIHIGKLSFYYILMIAIWFIQMLIGMLMGISTASQQVLLQFGLQYKSINCIAWYLVEEIIILFVMFSIYNLSYLMQVIVKKMKVAILLTILIPIVLLGLSYLVMLITFSYILTDFFAEVFLVRSITADILIIVPIAIISSIIYIFVILKADLKQ